MGPFPGEAVSVWPCWGVPLIVGSDWFPGGGCFCTGAVWPDAAGVPPETVAGGHDDVGGLADIGGLQRVAGARSPRNVRAEQAVGGQPAD